MKLTFDILLKHSNKVNKTHKMHLAQSQTETIRGTMCYFIKGIISLINSMIYKKRKTPLVVLFQTIQWKSINMLLFISFCKSYFIILFLSRKPETCCYFLKKLILCALKWIHCPWYFPEFNLLNFSSSFFFLGLFVIFFFYFLL